MCRFTTKYFYTTVLIRVCWFLILCLAFVQPLKAQGEFDCETASVLKAYLDERHVEPDRLEQDWGPAVFRSFVRNQDAWGLLFIQPNFTQKHNYKDNLEEIVASQTCDFLEDWTELALERLSIVDTLLATLQSAEVLGESGGALQKAAKVGDYATDEAALKVRWLRRLKSLFYEQKFLAPSSADETEDALLDRLIAQERCKLSKQRERIEEDDGYVPTQFFDAMALAYDPHTRYYHFQLTQLLNVFFSQNAASFGFQVTENEQGEISVKKLLPGGPAWRSNKMHVGDVIEKIRFSDGSEADLTCNRLSEVKNFILNKAKSGTEFFLKTATQERFSIKLNKEKVALDENAVRGYVLQGEKKMGYVSLPDFYKGDDDEESEELGCARDVAREIIKLKRENIDGLILDLRSNGGGSLLEALELLGIFIEEGPLIIHEKEDKVRILRDRNRGAIYLGPMVLLVNGQSASASELVAATLQDYNRALIVGDTTFGKAVGQRIEQLGSFFKTKATKATDKLEPAALKITRSRIYRLNGGGYQSLGVAPDIYLPEVFEASERKESLYPFALELKSIERHPYFEPLPALPVSQVADLHQKRMEEAGLNELIRLNTAISSERNKLTDELQETYFQRLSELEAEKRNQFETFLARRKGAYAAANHKFDKILISISPEKKALEAMTFQDLENNIYIQAAYDILADLIETTEH